jgi:histidine ammonia-lyase
MKQNITIDGNSLRIPDVLGVITGSHLVSLKKQTYAHHNRARAFLEKESKKNIIYGVNTGFGPMASYALGKDQLTQLQYNLIVSHAVGLGEPVAPEFIRAAMIVRLNTLAKGFSGVSVGLLEQLAKFINKGIIPIVPEHGAVGTSGDLVQLAHIALALIGEGEAWHNGKRKPVKRILQELRIKPYELKSKEGLALINGTAFMTGIATLLADRGERIFDLALANAALALEVTNSFSDSLSEDLHSVRAHPGQRDVAKELRDRLRSSKLLKHRNVFQKKFEANNDAYWIPELVQDVYSFRCIPQILGPVLESLQKHQQTVAIEMNSVTDNPVVRYDKKTIIHGGNFHGEYIAASVDELKASFAKLVMLSERRTNFLLSVHVNKRFPPFANLATPGFNLGLQGLQFVATSTTAQTQSLAFPHRVHSIPTNADNQDLVSMGTDAALMASKVLDNAYIVLTIETLTLVQLVDHLKVRNQLSDSSKKLYALCRKIVPTLTTDRPIQPQISLLVETLKQRNEKNKK